MPTFLFVGIIVCTQCVLMGEYRALITYIYILCISSVFLLSNTALQLALICRQVTSTRRHSPKLSVHHPGLWRMQRQCLVCILDPVKCLNHKVSVASLPLPPSLPPSPSLPPPPSLPLSLPPSLPPSLSLSPYYNNNHIHNFPTSLVMLQVLRFSILRWRSCVLPNRTG